MEGALFAGKSLANYFGIVVDQYAHSPYLTRCFQTRSNRDYM